jgi:hypothetical protein
VIPPLWAEIAAAPYLPLSDTLYAGGPVHLEHAGYHGAQINQADGACRDALCCCCSAHQRNAVYAPFACAVALLQYPLGLDFGAAQNQRDLDFYSTVTDFAGMFTGDSRWAFCHLYRSALESGACSYKVRKNPAPVLTPAMSFVLQLLVCVPRAG